MDRHEEARAEHREVLSVSVAIPAFSMERWELLQRAVESARSQTVRVAEVVVCIDNNDELLARAQREWQEASGTPVTVIPNRHNDHLSRVTAHQAAHGTARRFGAGSARNTASEAINSDIVAFMDDDAEAHPDWLEQLLRVYEDPEVVAVGDRRCHATRRSDRPGTRQTSIGFLAALTRDCRTRSRRCGT